MRDLSRRKFNLADADNSIDSITTTYAGEFAGKYISAALLSGDTLDKGGIEIMPNVKYKQVIKKVASTDILKNATCDFDLQADVLTLTEQVIEPEEFQVNLQVCKKDFRNDWEAVQMGFSTFDNLPPKFSDFLIGHVSAKVAEKIEKNIWQGENASAGEFDGFTTLFDANPTGLNNASATASSVTSSNVVAELEKLANAIPSTVLYQDDLHIYVGNAIWQAYVRSLGGFTSVGAAGFEDRGSNQDLLNGSLLFDGIKIFRAPGMPGGRMVAAQKSNLYFGTGLLSDQNEVKVIDMADIDGSQNVRVVMRMTAGIQYGIASDIAYYKVSPEA